MQQQEIKHFLEKFFLATNCAIVENDPSYITVQLTVEMDKELMNRPFYWHYLEKTGGKPNPMKLTFITNQTEAPGHIKGEKIHFGSPRLHQIFQSAKKLSKYIRLYERVRNEMGKNIPLYPWLCLNLKISYQCDLKRDVFKSVGLQLINGRYVEPFYDRLEKLELTPKIPDYSFTISPLIKPQSGIIRIENKIKNELEKENHEWADEARKRWDEDLQLLEHFYAGEEKGEAYEKEKIALKDQYEPKINISIINGGLFYLTENAV